MEIIWKNVLNQKNCLVSKILSRLEYILDIEVQKKMFSLQFVSKCLSVFSNVLIASQKI